MKYKHFLLLACVGCGSGATADDTADGTAPADTGGDQSTGMDAAKDAPSKDSGGDASGMDAADDGAVDAGGVDSGKDGGGGGKCKTAQDCRLFSSYCSTDPCVCFGLGANDPDPKCNGSPVTCFVDPCLNKKADCDGGTCVAVP